MRPYVSQCLADAHLADLRREAAASRRVGHLTTRRGIGGRLTAATGRLTATLSHLRRPADTAVACCPA